jgi:hypothetical protein
MRALFQPNGIASLLQICNLPLQRQSASATTSTCAICLCIVWPHLNRTLNSQEITSAEQFEGKCLSKVCHFAATDDDLQPQRERFIDGHNESDVSPLVYLLSSLMVLQLIQIRDAFAHRFQIREKNQSCLVALFAWLIVV